MSNSNNCKEMQVSNLIGMFDNILKMRDKGIVVGNPDKDAVKKALKEYLKCLSSERDRHSVFDYEIEHELEPYDSDEECKKIMHGTSTIVDLLRVAREKMVLVNDFDNNREHFDSLVELGYCDEIAIKEGGKKYMVLSPKGERVLTDSNILDKMVDERSESVIPQALVSDSHAWSSLYVKRSEMMSKYYRGMLDTEYITFAMGTDDDMVFGCEVSDSDEVKYAFAAVFDERGSDQVSYISALLATGLIDELVVLGNNREEIDYIKSKGIVSSEDTVVSYELI